MVTEELKPCPFCGEIPTEDYIPPHEHYFSFMPAFSGMHYAECATCDFFMSSPTKEELIEKWNRRATT